MLNIYVLKFTNSQPTTITTMYTETAPSGDFLILVNGNFIVFVAHTMILEDIHNSFFIFSYIWSIGKTH